MPFITPTLAEVRRLNRDAIAAHLPGADATIPNSRLRVLAEANAGLASLTLGYIDWLSRQLLPDTAEGSWLDRHADIWVGGRQPATLATGSATVTGASGAVLSAASRLVYGGAEFETLADVTVGVGATPVSIRALDAGASGNLPAGARLALAVAASGIDATAVVVSLSGGVDAEGDDSLRDRVLFRIRRPPMGGDADDYVAWAREVPGVTRAWCSPLEMGMGTVTLRFMMDDLRASNAGFPLAGDVAAVRAHLDAVRPVAVKDFFVVAPIPEPIPFTVTSLYPDTAATRAALQATVAAMLRLRAAPAHALNGVRQDGQTIYEAWVSEAISATPGIEHFRLEMDDHAMPSNGAMAVPGTVTFV